MRAAGQSPSPPPASSSGLYAFEVVAGESNAKNVVETPIDNNTSGKKIAGCSFNPQRCTRGQVWLIIFQVDDIRVPLCAGSQSSEDKLVESFRTKRYQYGVRLMAVTSPAPGKLGSVTAPRALQELWKELFFKTGFSLAIYDSRHPLSCTPKRACSRPLSTKWSLRLVWMNRIATSDSKAPQTRSWSDSAAKPNCSPDLCLETSLLRQCEVAGLVQQDLRIKLERLFSKASANRCRERLGSVWTRKRCCLVELSSLCPRYKTKATLFGISPTC